MGEIIGMILYWWTNASVTASCSCVSIIPNTGPAGFFSDFSMIQFIFSSSSLECRERMGSGWSGSCVTQVPERWQSSRPPICGFICLQFIPEQLGLTIQLECVQGIQMYLLAMHSPFRKVMPLCIHCLTYIKPKQKSFCSCAFMEFFHHLRELGNG